MVTTFMTSRSRQLRTLMLSLGIAVVSGACTEEPPVAPESSFTGSWDLIAINDRPLPYTYEILLGGGRRIVTGGEIVVRSRGRLYDIKRQSTPDGEFTDTLVSPFSASPTQLLIRRYALNASSDWVDTGEVFVTDMRLEVRELEPRFRTSLPNVSLMYRKRP